MHNTPKRFEVRPLCDGMSRLKNVIVSYATLAAAKKHASLVAGDFDEGVAILDRWSWTVDYGNGTCSADEFSDFSGHPLRTSL